MTKSDKYREALRTLREWEPYLLAESGLPGPRGNLELAQVVAGEGDEALFVRLLQYGPDVAPVNSPYEFLAFCGVVGLGRLVAEGRKEYVKTLRACASDPRWRLREGVAMALQRWGQADMDALLREMAKWARGKPLEQRAAAAGLCEPALLHEPRQVERVLQILDEITASIPTARDRKSPEFEALRKGLGYCWSVAVAALPKEGRPFMEKWCGSADPDIRWIMRENLGKNRLVKAAPEWVTKMQAEVSRKA